MAVGDITYTNKGGEQPYSAIATGSLVVDADADANIICGFHPSMVMLILADAGGTADALLIRTEAFPAGDHLRVANDGELTIPTSLGFVAYTADAGLGFTIPANQTGAADSDIIYWIAFR